MTSEWSLKLRAYIAVSIIVLLFPFILTFVIIFKIFQPIFGWSKCKSVAGEVAVITGAAHGLGREIAIKLADEGCHVAIVDINFELAENTAKLISSQYGVKAKAYKVDVSNHDQVSNLNERVTKDLGIATIIVNNAAIIMFANPLNPSVEEVQRMINVNLTSHFWMNRTFLPGIKEMGKGHIVAIGSSTGLFPLNHYAEYTSTKFGVRGLMRVLRQELKAGGFNDIHCTTVMPSFMSTNTQVTEIADSLQMDQVYPSLKGDEAGKRVVKAILQNKKEIVLPGFLGLLYRLFEILPCSMTDWINWFIIKSSIRKYQELMKEKHKLS